MLTFGAGGGGAGGGGAKLGRCSMPAPLALSFPAGPMLVAFCARSDCTGSADQPGWRLRTSAAAPATWGAAAELPRNPLVPHSPEYEPKAGKGDEMLSGPTRSGLTRPSIVGPCEL